jgi:hypothetical protein
MSRWIGDYDKVDEIVPAFATARDDYNVIPAHKATEDGPKWDTRLTGQMIPAAR